MGSSPVVLCIDGPQFLSSLLASAVEHLSVPGVSGICQGPIAFESQMVIRPHKSFDEVSRGIVREM